MFAYRITVIGLLGGRRKMHSRIRGKYALIEWSRAAKDYCIGDPALKRISVYNKVGKRMVEYPYGEATITNLMKMGIPVVDATGGLDKPIDCIDVMKIDVPVGIIHSVGERGGRI